MNRNPLSFPVFNKINAIRIIIVVIGCLFLISFLWYIYAIPMYQVIQVTHETANQTDPTNQYVGIADLLGNLWNWLPIIAWLIVIIWAVVQAQKKEWESAYA